MIHQHINDIAFDADFYSIHKNHKGEKFDRDISVEDIEATYQRLTKEQNKRLYTLEIDSLLLS